MIDFQKKESTVKTLSLDRYPPDIMQIVENQCSHYRHSEEYNETW